jgi:hypothetical protein
VIRTIGSYLEPGQDVSSKGALVGVLHTLLDAISLLGLRPTAKAQAFQPQSDTLRTIPFRLDVRAMLEPNAGSKCG